MILDHIYPTDPRVKNEAESLIESGFEVYLFCLSFKKNFVKNEIIDGIKICRFFCSKITYKLSALAYTIPLYKYIMSNKIETFISNNDINILHVHDIQIASSVFLANKSNNLDVVLDLHENRPEIMKYYKHVNSFLGKILINPKKWKKAEENFVKRSKKVIVVTKQAKKELTDRVSVDKEKIVVFPNTVSQKFYNNYKIDKKISRKYSGNFVMLYIGNTSKRRGLDLVLENIPKIISEIKNFKFVIVGSSSYDSEIKQKVEYLEIADYVDIEGWKDESLFQSYILSSSIGVSPLESNIHHDTTYANKIFQYLSLGCPVLCSDVVTQLDLINKYKFGLSFKSGDSEDFLKKVLVMYRNKSLLLKLKKNAKNAIIQSLNNSIVSKNMVRIYEKK